MRQPNELEKPTDIAKMYQKEYNEGRTFFAEKCSVNTRCPDGPYPSSEREKKISWLTGWLDARTEAALGPKFGN